MLKLHLPYVWKVVKEGGASTWLEVACILALGFKKLEHAKATQCQCSLLHHKGIYKHQNRLLWHILSKKQNKKKGIGRTCRTEALEEGMGDNINIYKLYTCN